MDFFYIAQLARACLRELWLHRYGALAGGFLVGIAVLVFGMFWQEKYTVSSSLYADRQNIIAPLLKDRAQVTKVEDQIQLVKDLMLSNRILEKIVQSDSFAMQGLTPAKLSAVSSGIRSKVNIRSLGKNYISVSYSDVNPDRAYSVVTQLVDLFIQESSDNKRSESRQAFLFIDKQVSSYKDQLRQAEQRLKEFNASNLDGSESRVMGSIENLRKTIADLELDLGQANERVASLSAQVDQEDRYLTRKARADEYRDRIADAVTQLDELKLSYTDMHPDVIALADHIQALRNAAASSSASASGSNSGIGGVENPVYDELRGALASAKVEKNTITKRLRSLRSRLVEERQRAKRISERDAELAELTRDYSVTKGLYEDLLERKEQARLSMTLDIEGQGVSFKIQEPAKYPQFASGLRYVHFVILGIVAAVVVPIGLIVVFIFLDPRIRFSNVIEGEFDVSLLGEIPHLVSSPIQRMRKMDVRLFILMFVACSAVYCSAAFMYLLWG
ncbi:MAG: chain length-determining protein [Gammaproteobacteria bacterium]|nr:chain length-determining protein [Gammaproteobacteria bacterium]NND40352.1 chain length-determining protein [Pseudomonadales bacterium]